MRKILAHFQDRARCSMGIVRRLDRRAENSVLLTFDDGPDPEVTPAVLERLARFQARAVFFVVGCRIGRAPHLLTRIVQEGHLIGNHSYAHWLGEPPGVYACYRDFSHCQSAVQTRCDRRPSLFRAPLGAWQWAPLAAARLCRLRPVHWSLDVRDWMLRDDISAAAAGQKLAGLARPRDIVLLHDDNRCVLAILDCLLRSLRDRGFDLQHGAKYL